jgi:hypothetical protein
MEALVVVVNQPKEVRTINTKWTKYFRSVPQESITREKINGNIYVHCTASTDHEFGCSWILVDRRAVVTTVTTSTSMLAATCQHWGRIFSASEITSVMLCTLKGPPTSGFCVLTECWELAPTWVTRMPRESAVSGVQTQCTPARRPTGSLPPRSRTTCLATRRATPTLQRRL